MSKRKFKKAIERASNLPRGVDFFSYVSNKLKGFNLKLSNSLEITNPSSIMIEVTNLCNLKCITCAREYKYGAAMNKGMIDYDLATNIVDMAYPYIDSIGLTGLGETLLYKKLPDLVKYIKHKSNGIITFISTNAHVENIEDRVSPLAGNVDTLQISIDGIGDVYNSIRGKANYDFFIDNVKSISEIVKNTKTDLMFNAVIFDKNYHQMKQLIELAKSLNVRYVYFNTMNLVSTDWDTSLYEFYKSDKFKNELQLAKDEATRSGIELQTFDFETPAGFSKCGFPWNHFYITWDGYVVPCCAKPFPLELNFGNLNDQSLMSCLNSDGFKEFRGKWQRNETPQFCENCHMTDLNL